MFKLIKIDKSIYIVDDEDKSYRLYKRNPEWEKLSPQQNIKNKRYLNGYTKMLGNDKTKTYVWKQ